MKNTVAISSIARTLVKVAEKLETLAYSSRDTEETDEELSNVYDDLLIDEVNHVQKLTIELTKVIIPEEPDDENTDEGESAFGPGELRDEVRPPKIDRGTKQEK